MCFSATASFVSAAVLLPLGVYATFTALKRAKSLFFVALIPFIFGIQQFIEGVEWILLKHSLTQEAFNFALLYLFFAFFVWPFYIPFSLAYAESRSFRKKLLKIFTIFGVMLGSILYLPLAFHFIPLHTKIAGHCINYIIDQPLWILTYASYTYVLFVTVAAFISSNLRLNMLGVLNFVSAYAAYYFYTVTFVSTWCFFAAVSSLYIIYVIRRS